MRPATMTLAPPAPVSRPPAVREPKILFATDFAGDVRGGLRLATRLAAERGATVIVLHVLPLDPAEGEGLLHAAVALSRGEPERRLARLVPDDAAVPFRHAVELGDPAACIAAFVEREGIELLVLEARPRSALGRVFGRSLPERLIGNVSCPVVTYRAGAVTEC